jgi:triosephosphate isomerase
VSAHALKTPVIAGNWKMHKGPLEATSFLSDFVPLISPAHAGSVVLFPPAVSVHTCATLLRDRPDVLLGIQNIHWEAKGAFTGEVSAVMAAQAGARLALIGHSERRHVFGETDDQTRLKVRAALDAGLMVMLCVGETLEERRAGRLEDVILRQLAAGLKEVTASELSRTAIAYEPVWAIGTGVNATPEDASAAHAVLRASLATRNAAGATLPILYGGSVKPDNAAELLDARGIDGLLVGGASLDPAGFARICVPDG